MCIHCAKKILKMSLPEEKNESNTKLDTTKFSVKSLNEEELKLYHTLFNQCFFYYGYPAAIVTGSLAFVILTKKIPTLSQNRRILFSFGVSLLGNEIGRDFHKPAMQKKVIEELPKTSYFRQCVENQTVFKSFFCKNVTSKS